MAEGIAVGVVYFTAKQRAEGGGGGGHAINFAVVGKPEERKIIFIEPQFAGSVGIRPVIELSEEEIRSIWFINL